MISSLANFNEDIQLVLIILKEKAIFNIKTINIVMIDTNIN